MVRSRIDRLYGKFYNEWAIPKTFTHLSTTLIYTRNIENLHKGYLTEVVRGSDKYLKSRVVKVLSNKIRTVLEDGGIKSSKSTSIRLTDPDHLLRDSIPIPRMTLGYTDNITRR